MRHALITTVLRLCAAAFMIVGLAASPSLAQTREEIDRRPISPVPQGAPQSITVDDGIERAPCPLAAPQFANIEVTLDRAEFENTADLPAGLLDDAARPFIGRKIPIATVCEIRDRAATTLRSKGYLAAVRVPPQTIDNGTVRFQVLLAKIVDFQVRGNAGRGERLIAGYLDRIRQQSVFNILDAERHLLLARDIPGYDVRLTLRPAGREPGEVVGEVLVRYTPVTVEANFQNYGSQSTGRWGGIVQARLNGVLIPGDQTRLSFFNTAEFKEQHVVQLGEQVLVGHDGLSIAGEFVHAWTRPELGGGIDLRSKTWVASLEARYPLIRRQARTLGVTGGFEAVDQDVRVGGVPLTRDKLRAAYLRFEFAAIDPGSITSSGGFSAGEPRWRITANAEIRHGFNGLGASKGCGPLQARCRLPGVVPPSRLEADASAFVARGQMAGEFRILPVLGFQLSARGQYSRKPLLSYEEFSGGNFTVGRGFDPGIIAGDSGFGTSGELRYGRLAPENDRDVAWQVYGFTDAAWVWNRDTVTLAGFKERLYSAGGGVRLAFGDRMLVDAMAAVPLSRAGSQARRGDTRFLINFTTRLVPWNRR